MNSMVTYYHFPNFILRTPLFPMERIKSLVQGTEVAESDLFEICRNPFIKEALYLASPSFYREVLKWLDGKLPSRKEEDRMKNSLIRYFGRMCTRCTPFGMFAGISVGRIGENTCIEMPDKTNVNLHVRLDMNYVYALAKYIADLDMVRNKLQYYPNTSLYAMGDKLRYVEYTYVKAKRSHHLSVVDNSSYLQNVLDASRNGKTLADLALILVNDGISLDEASTFINELVKGQLLISELEPTVIGIDPLEKIIDVLKRYEDNEIKSMIEALQTVNEALHRLRITPCGHLVSDYESIKEKLSAFPTQYDEKFLFQGDMLIRPKSNEVGKELTDDILTTVAMLNRITPRFENENLKAFREAFHNRYEDEEIPLALALDSETGIGYLQNTYSGITPLVDDIAFPMRIQGFRTSRTLPFHVLMERKLSNALRKGNRCISIDEEDLKGFDARWDDIQETISVFVQIMDDNKYYIRSVGGSCAANLIGRFCHVDEAILNHTRQIINKDESEDDSIYAEIVHLPESRIGNILHRPNLRKYEIPYLAQSSLPSERQIPLEDLMVSVRGDHILLRSKKHNKIVIPRLTTAHNFSFNALPVYQFLCDMQNHGKCSGFGFSWGAMEYSMPYLPRVVYKNAILSLETWNFFKKDLDRLNSIKDMEQRVDVFLEMVDDMKVEEEVLLEDNDNELYLNLKNRTCVKVLLDLVKKRSGFTLKEFLFATNGSPVNSGISHFANEILFSYYKHHNEGGIYET